MRAHYYRAVNVAKSITRLQIIKPYKSTGLSSICNDLAFLYFKRTHIVKNNLHVLEIPLTQNSECFQGFALSSSGVPKNNHICGFAAFEGYSCHCTMHRHSPAGNHN